jgi:hypothetical protein
MYREVIIDMKKSYRKIDSKAAKTDLSRAIVDHVHKYGGRFLKKDPKVGEYYVLTLDEARRKTAQCLRETKDPIWLASNS